MNAILNALLEITVFSAVLYGAILLFQRVFRKHISAGMNYAVWALLILRLIIPTTVDSGLHLFIIPDEPRQAAYTAVSTNNAPPQNYPLTYQPISDNTSLETPISTETDYTPVSSQEIKPWNISWQTVLVLIWGAGGLLSFGFVAILSRRLRRKIKHCGTAAQGFVLKLINKCKSDMGIRTNINVSVQTWLKSPALSASLKPILLIPEHMLRTMDLKQLEFGIRHELTHYKRRDHLMNLLLMVLRCVYWFNPVIYLAFRSMQTDMETACDARITSRLKAAERTRYIRTMIDLGGSGSMQYILGMGMSKGGREMEKRVRGIFMKKRTRLPVRMAAVLLAMLMLVACFTTACQPTPVKPVVVNKGDGQLDQLIAQTNVPMQKYSAPPGWKETVHSVINGTDITVDIDSKVDVPAVEAFPAVAITPGQITFEQIQAVLDEVSKGQKLYDSQFAAMTDTKIKIQEKIDYYTEELKGATGEEYKDIREEYENILRQLYKDLETAPDSYAQAEDAVRERLEGRPETEGENAPAPTFAAETDIGPVTITEDNYRREQGFDLEIGEVYNPGKITIMASGNTRLQRITYYRNGVLGGFQTSAMDLLGTLKISREDAEKEARRVAGALNTGLELTDVCALVDYDFTGPEKKEIPVGYTFCFTRLYNGVPLRYSMSIDQRGAKKAADPSSPQYREPWQDERLVISVGEEGLTNLEYQSPAEVVETESENVALMPFDQVQETFRKQILLRPMWTEIPSTTRVYLKIDKAALTMVKVAKKDNPDEYRMIPAWNFCGNFKRAYIENGKERESSLSDFYFRSFLTINAIDGSIIDKGLGY